MTQRLVGALLALGLLSTGCGAATPAVLRPVVADVQRACPSSALPLRPGEVFDRRGFRDPASIGFTQAELSAAKTLLLTDPAPAQLVRARLDNVLRACTAPPGARAARVNVVIERFDAEQTGWLPETMAVQLALNVQVVAAGGEHLATFDVRAHAQRAAHDASESARRAIEEGLHKAEAALVKGLAALHGARAALAGAAVTAPAAPPMAPRVQAQVRYVAPALEEALFDKRLLEAGVVPLELELSLHEPGAAILVPREGMTATFVDGKTVAGLDADQARALVTGHEEIVRVDDVMRLGSVGDAYRTLIFFPSPTMPRATPESVVIELLDARTGRAEKIAQRIADARLTPGED